MSEETTKEQPAQISTDWPNNRVKVPTVIQMEAVECGAASFAMILGYYGRWESLEQLRVACGVSRDGSKASNILTAARQRGFECQGWRKELEELKTVKPPFIVFWNFNHFLVVEGFGPNGVYLADPASGPRTVSIEEFDECFTGIVLTFEKTDKFKPGGQKHSIFKSLKQRLTGYKNALLFVLLGGLALVLPGLVVPTFSKIFVDEILVQELRGWLRPLLLGMFLTGTVMGLLTWLQQKYLLRLENKLSISTSSRFLWHVLRLPMEFYAQRFGGEIGSRVALNDRVASLLSGQLATNAINCLMVVFYAILMLQYSVVLTFMGVFIAAFNMYALKYVSRRRNDENQRLLQEQGKMLGTAMSGLQTIETLKATGGEDDFFSKWAGYQAKTVNAGQRLGFYTLTLEAIPPLLFSLNNALILAVGGFMVMDGDLTMGMLIAFQALMNAFMMPINNLVNLGSQLQQADGDLKRLDDVLSNKPMVLSEAELSKEDFQAGKTKLSGFLELKNITFGYSRLEKPLIENFSLKLKPGSRVALVGGSGSGKSTISKIITGLYEPWEGEVLFDGKTRLQIPRNVMSNSLALVDQDIFMFEGSVRDNLTLWDHTIEDHSVTTAAKDACIHDDIAIRPHGYDSTVEEGGANFSGGQKQRLEIARALSGNPCLLVLDEATSALDAITEKIIDDNLRRRGCTCVIIAHRLSTIRDCDEIIVLQRGKVMQRGTHDELKDVEGTYKDLIQSE